MANRELWRTTLVLVTALLLAEASTSASQRQARRLPEDGAWPPADHVDNHVAAGAAAQQRGAREGAAALADVARALAARTASTSQVLSLNLTNLLILLVLKALLFGAGIFSFGLLGKQHYGRADAAPAAALSVSEAELALALAFLSGEAAPGGGGGGHSCLQRAACDAPHTATRYAVAASAALSAAKALSSMVGYNPRYEEIVSGMKSAVEFGKSGGSCSERYKCSEK